MKIIPNQTNNQHQMQDIESQLTDLELRHKRHQQLMEDQHDRKWQRREDHKKRRYRIKQIPILLR